MGWSSKNSMYSVTSNSPSKWIHASQINTNLGGSLMSTELVAKWNKVRTLLSLMLSPHLCPAKRGFKGFIYEGLRSGPREKSANVAKSQSGDSYWCYFTWPQDVSLERLLTSQKMHSARICSREKKQLQAIINFYIIYATEVFFLIQILLLQKKNILQFGLQFIKF